jgi:uncharacterized damage-inducible protein DinB
VVEDKNELIRHYTRSRAELLAAIEGLSDELLSEPSLDGWSVKDHLLHLTLWDDLRAGEIARISAGHEPAVKHMTDEQIEALNTLERDRRKDMSPTQVKWELQTSRQRVLDAISGATERGLDDSLYGEAALRSTHEAVHMGWIKRWRSEKGV